jgi:hypothetical protein
MSKAILGYTTSVPVGRTVGQIQSMLAEAGATAVMIDYVDKEPSAICFVIDRVGVPVSVRMPSRVGHVAKALRRPGVPCHARRPEQVKRIAWRILFRWVEVQCAMVELEQADMLEVFLPYVVTENGSTVYSRLISGDVPLLPREAE